MKTIFTIILTIIVILIIWAFMKFVPTNQAYNDHMMIDVYGHENGQDINK